MADYTTDQQRRIEEATKKVEQAKKTYDDSVIVLSGLYERAKRDGDLWNSIFQCKGYKGKTKNWEILDPGDCEVCIIYSNCPGCTKDQCIRRIGLFNDAYKAWSSYKETVANNLTAYETAKSDLKRAQDLIAGEIKTATDNDPLVVAAKTAAKSRTIQIAIFGVIALVIIVVVIMVLKR